MCFRFVWLIIKCNRLLKVVLYVWVVIEKFIIKIGSVNGSIYWVSEYIFFIKLDFILFRYLYVIDWWVFFYIVIVFCIYCKEICLLVFINKNFK